MSKILKGHDLKDLDSKNQDSVWPPKNTKDLGSKDAKQEAPVSKFNTLAEALKKVKLG